MRRVSTNPEDAYDDLLSESWDQALKGAGPDPTKEIRYYPEFADRPVAFHKEVLGRTLWEASEYTIEALHKYRVVTIRACRKASKTHTGSGIICEFMSTGQAAVISLSTTEKQIRRQLWGSVRQAFATADRKLPGKIFIQNWDVTPEWYAIGLATNDPDNVLGFHAGVTPPTDEGNAAENMLRIAHSVSKKSSTKKLLFLLDEAQGIDPIFYDAFFGSLSGDNVYGLIQGNPTKGVDDPHPYVKLHHPGSMAHRIHIGAVPSEPFENPLGQDKSFTKVPEWLCNPEWIVSMRKLWKEGSPAYLSFVKGQFASSADVRQKVITESMLQAAQNVAGTSHQGRHIGVDVSRSENGDEAVASLWVNGVKMAEHTWRGLTIPDTSDLIIALMVEWGDRTRGIPVSAQNVHVDITGLGIGVMDRLNQRGYYVDGVDFGSAPVGDWLDLTGEMLFLNRRAELHFIYRRALEEGYGHLPYKWTNSWDQAKWPTYELRTERSTGTVIAIEPKDNIKSKYKRSPDNLESDILAWSRSSTTPTITLMD